MRWFYPDLLLRITIILQVAFITKLTDSVFGDKALAIVHSLPYVLLMWGWVLFNPTIPSDAHGIIGSGWYTSSSHFPSWYLDLPRSYFWEYPELVCQLSSCSQCGQVGLQEIFMFSAGFVNGWISPDNWAYLLDMYIKYVPQSNWMRLGRVISLIPYTSTLTQCSTLDKPRIRPHLRVTSSKF